MKRIIAITILLLHSLIFSSFLGKDIDKEFGRDHNVCKTLRGNVLLYIVWVETRSSEEWKQYDLNSTLDSIAKAVDWIHKKASINNIPLKLNYDNGMNDSIYVVSQKLGGEVPAIIQEKDGVERIDKWTDKIIKYHSGKKSKLALLSDLRNSYRCESVALIFMLNNYYKEDYIYSFNTTSNDNVEYAIVSTKRPNLIAQNILNLFGAPYLYHHPMTLNKGATNKLQKIFSDDIMANTTGNIDHMKIGNVTKYFIGWSDDLDEEYERMVKEKTKI